ncbi:Delta-aminolevulinic acid dehydratase, partial [Fasciola gigantica]
PFVFGLFTYIFVTHSTISVCNFVFLWHCGFLGKNIEFARIVPKFTTRASSSEIILSRMHSSHPLHASYKNRLMRQWQTSETKLSSENFVYPIFISDDPNASEEIPSLVKQKRLGINKLIEHLAPLVEKKLSSVILFGVVSPEVKDAVGSHADSNDSVIVNAVKIIKYNFPTLTVICDVCLCPYTDHGHCGMLCAPSGNPVDIGIVQEGRICVERSVARLAEIATRYAVAGKLF